MKNSQPIRDPVESAVACALDSAGVKYVHESQDKSIGLDFYLPDHDCYIECKAYHTPRTAKQVEDKQVILVQGYKAADTFYKLVSRTPERVTVEAKHTREELVALLGDWFKRQNIVEDRKGHIISLFGGFLCLDALINALIEAGALQVKE